MTTTTLDIDYYSWLTEQIHIPNDRTYGELFERMHNVEFVWIVPNDDNRVQEGIDLRTEFTNGKSDALNLNGATFLEVFVALSRRLAATAGSKGQAPQRAWEMLKNLRLQKANDPMNNAKREEVDNILHTVIWRLYREDGLGGFFPLQNPDKDQTKVELWYQLNAYVNEMTDL